MVVKVPKVGQVGTGVFCPERQEKYQVTKEQQKRQDKVNL
jgi:hypothetical protein